MKFQAEVAARSSKTYDVTLEPGPYRFRTVEAGGEADADLSPDDAMPAIIARGNEIRLEAPGSPNATRHPQRNRPSRSTSSSKTATGLPTPSPAIA